MILKFKMAGVLRIYFTTGDYTQLLKKKGIKLPAKQVVISRLWRMQNPQLIEQP